KSNIDVVLWRVLFNIHQTQEADVFNFDSCFLSDFALCAVFKGLHVFHMTTWPSPLPLTMGAFALAYEHLVTFQDHDPHTYSRPLFVLHCVFTFPTTIHPAPLLHRPFPKRDAGAEPRCHSGPQSH